MEWYLLTFQKDPMQIEENSFKLILVMRKLFNSYIPPDNGDFIEITWLPNNFGHRNAYIGMRGIVHNVSKDGFELKTETSWLIVGNQYKFKNLKENC